MKIERHNYEEYFLLYIDNELTVEQKKQVELFVKDNPDLEEELVMLQQSRLVPDDTIVFEEKHLLMREENNSFINLNNYEEWLVLYVDNELNKEEKTTVEKFAGEHPHVQQELALFQQTKLQPEEELKFANKSSLYRREEKVRIISIAWWRATAAAILIIAAGITMYSILYKKSTSGTVITNNELTKTKKNQGPNTVKPLPTNQQLQTNPAIIKEEKEQVAVISTATNKPKQKENKKQPTDNLSSSTSGQMMVKKNIPQKRPVIVNEINTARLAEPKINNAVAIGVRTHKEFFNELPVTNPTVQTPDESNTSDNGVEIANNTENKRLRGFFRKATRLIERTTNINPANDDNRVLIGGMAINLK